MKKNKTTIKKLLKKVKILVLDVDGVLTQGEIIYDDQGRELKVFNVKDGLGIYLLNKVGIKTIMLSARDSEVIRKRAKDMGVSEVIGGVLPKEGMIDVIANNYGVKKNQMCFIGDDLIDIGCIRNVGVGVAVGDAPKIVKQAACFVTERYGGQCAVREVVDLIIEAQKLEKKIFAILKNPR